MHFPNLISKLTLIKSLQVNETIELACMDYILNQKLNQNLMLNQVKSIKGKKHPHPKFDHLYIALVGPNCFG